MLLFDCKCVLGGFLGIARLLECTGGCSKEFIGNKLDRYWSLNMVQVIHCKSVGFYSVCL